MRLASVAILLVVVVSFPLVTAQQPQEFPSTSGNAFVRVCSAIDKKAEEETHVDVEHAVACIGYVEGVVQGISEEVNYVHAKTDKEPPRPFCLPDGTENGQLIRVVLKYIGDHPEKAHYSSALLIGLALMDAFPCKPRTDKKQ